MMKKLSSLENEVKVVEFERIFQVTNFSKSCTSFQELTLFHGFSLRVRSFKKEPSRMGSSLSTFMKRNAAEIFQNSRVMKYFSCQHLRSYVQVT